MRIYIGLLSLALLLGGCATNKPQVLTPALHDVNDVLKKDVKYAVDVYDPWEGFNHCSYRFNYGFDKYLFLPVVYGYEFILPKVVETGASNFWSNISEISTFVNSLVQMKGGKSLTSLKRFGINTTIGIVGLWDHATKFGILQEREDFGQTLGHYNVGPGPYFVIPIMGPSSLRDGAGALVDSVLPPLGMFSTLEAIDARHLASFRYYETGSPFELDLVRKLYLSKRELEIAK